MDTLEPGTLMISKYHSAQLLITSSELVLGHFFSIKFSFIFTSKGETMVSYESFPTHGEAVRYFKKVLLAEDNLLKTWGRARSALDEDYYTHESAIAVFSPLET